ncbi:MAG: hypothetical protein QE271_04825 [Bacteriovoracaceae bacterium]|nr:hypothetical protein [Bacteriovoracaceae bacterium]
MKFIMTSIVACLLPLSVFAEVPAIETTKIARALINNPKIVSQLKANNSDYLNDAQITEVKPGVFEYTLVFTRQCFCEPSTATVSILEDLTPTYAHGPIKYSSSMKIKTEK